MIFSIAKIIHLGILRIIIKNIKPITCKNVNDICNIKKYIIFAKSIENVFLFVLKNLHIFLAIFIQKAFRKKYEEKK